MVGPDPKGNHGVHQKPPATEGEATVMKQVQETHPLIRLPVDVDVLGVRAAWRDAPAGGSLTDGMVAGPVAC